MKQETTTNNDNILDKVIANMTEDTKALEEQNAIIEEAKEQKREVQNRLRESDKDLATFVKYASDQQLKRLEELGIETQDLRSSLNKVAEVAFDILGKTNNGEMTNGDLFEAYVKTFDDPENAFSYTDFNIKCRPLFNSQRLLRIEKEGKTSREDIIRINGFRKKAQPKEAQKPKSTAKDAEKKDAGK